MPVTVAVIGALATITAAIVSQCWPGVSLTRSSTAIVLPEQSVRLGQKQPFANAQFSMVITPALERDKVNVEVVGSEPEPRQWWDVKVPGRVILNSGEQTYFIDLLTLDAPGHTLKLQISKKI